MANSDLLEVLHIVSDWLKFAEAKNAAVVAVGGLFLSAILNIPQDAHVLAGIYFWSAILLLGVSGFVALCSFVPQLKAPSFIAVSIDENPDIHVPIYFADIGSMPLDEYEMQIQEIFEMPDVSGIEKHLVQQIHTNARIAVRKYAFFNVAVWLLIAAIFTPAGLLALLIMKKNGEI